MNSNGFAFDSKGQAMLPRARARYLAQSIKLEEEGPSGIISGALFVSGLLVLALIGWASVTHVAEVAKSRGEVVPAGLIENIQHLEGGIVEEILVRDGDRVREGDLLLRLAPSSTQSRLDQRLVRRVALALKAERLRAIREGDAPDLGDMADRYPRLASKEWIIYQTQLASHGRQLDVLDAQIHQKKEEWTRQKNRAESIESQVVLLQKQVEIRRKLEADKMVALTELLATQTRLAEALSEKSAIADSITVAQAAWEEARQRHLQLVAQFDKEIDLEAGEVARELAEVDQEIVGLRDRVQRLDVHSSVDGIVQGLSVTRAHAVVAPGQVIMEIVPVDDELLVEARLSPEDIGYIHEGQSADIKVDSYDSARFGTVEGTVSRLSPSTYLDERRQPYYRAEIALARPYLGDQPDRFRIIPGMTVEADIRTGDKTIMEFLMKPVTRGFDSAFSER